MAEQGNGIRNGEQYLEGLRDDREVWHRGTRVADVTEHPGLCRGAATLAGFMDRQCDPAFRDTVTYEILAVYPMGSKPPKLEMKTYI